jgi:hypothetical protein
MGGRLGFPVRIKPRQNPVTRISRVILLDRFIQHDVSCRSRVTADHHHDDSGPAPAITDARFATKLIKHFQIPIRGIEPGSSQSSHRHPTQAMLVSYPPNLESAAAPATALATSSWPRSGCAMVSRPTALVRRSIIARQDDAATVQKRQQIAEQFTLGLLGQLVRDAMLAEQLARKLAGR